MTFGLLPTLQRTNLFGWPSVQLELLPFFKKKRVVLTGPQDGSRLFTSTCYEGGSWICVFLHGCASSLLILPAAQWQNLRALTPIGFLWGGGFLGAPARLKDEMGTGPTLLACSDMFCGCSHAHNLLEDTCHVLRHCSLCNHPSHKPLIQVPLQETIYIKCWIGSLVHVGFGTQQLPSASC